MYYPAGIIGWRLAAMAGLPISVKFLIGYDDEAKVYIGHAATLKGVFAEGNTLEELIHNLKSAAHDILEIELKGKVVEAMSKYQELDNFAIA